MEKHNTDLSVSPPNNHPVVKNQIAENSTNVWAKRYEEYEFEQRSFSNVPKNDEILTKFKEEQCNIPEEVNPNHGSNRPEVSNKESWRTTVSQRNLIVNYLPQHVNDKDLHKLFRPFGKIQSVRVMKDLKAGYSFGFGFVNFVNDCDGEKAKHALHQTKLEDKTIKVNFARAASEDTQQTNLYVSNLPRRATESDVRKIFAVYGEILQVSLLRDKILDIPRGVAFVRYKKRNDALRAIIAMNGVQPDGLDDPINVRIAFDHGKQRAASFGSMFKFGRPKTKERSFKASPRSRRYDFYLRCKSSMHPYK